MHTMYNRVKVSLRHFFDLAMCFYLFNLTLVNSLDLPEIVVELRRKPMASLAKLIVSPFEPRSLYLVSMGLCPLCSPFAGRLVQRGKAGSKLRNRAPPSYL